jgi:hypothetical protein
MIGSLSGQDTSVLESTSFALRAEAFSDVRSRVSRKRLPPLSRADFVEALRILGRQLPHGDHRFELGDPEIEAVHTAFLRCSLATWLEVFGQPESVHEHRESAPLFPVHVWKYQCTDGPVYCVGLQAEELNGTRWVTFVRVCYF